MSPPDDGICLRYKIVPSGGAFVTAHVGVPAIAGHHLGSFVGADDHHLRMAGKRRRRWMHVQLPEPAPQRLVPLRRQVLVTEDHHQVVSEGTLDIGPGLVVDGVQVGTGYLGADDRRDRIDIDASVAGAGARSGNYTLLTKR